MIIIGKKMDLKQLNTFGLIENKPLVKLSELPLDAPHPTISLKVTKGKFGESIFVELEDKAVFLPKRVTDYLKPNIKKFTTLKYSLIYRGTKEVGKPQPANQFEIVDTREE
ncbi:hypothetical protein NQ314_005092 [Rhamnusium bicolor]|uniref:Uncharacterized protein n=1 Tax=Rhamnusium bicolor TaxID=1586634 RepID=A0AAV8ZKN0_9CUCU|nr:hypothetical protein NQ314_005092 [Rhamnusium bicolor]